MLCRFTSSLCELKNFESDAFILVWAALILFPPIKALGAGELKTLNLGRVKMIIFNCSFSFGAKCLLWIARPVLAGFLLPFEQSLSDIYIINYHYSHKRFSSCRIYLFISS
jgi:hypothetical protein